MSSMESSAAGHGRFDGEELDIDVRHIHRSALYRQVADDRRDDTGAVHKAGNLDAGVFYKIGDKSCVQDVSADAVRRICDDRFQNMRRIFDAARMLDIAAVHDFRLLCFPFFDLIHAAARIFIEWNVIFFD